MGLSRKSHDLDVALATVSTPTHINSIQFNRESPLTSCDSQVNLNFYVPFWREFMLALGFLDASFRSLQAALNRQRSVAIVVGGAAEVRQRFWSFFPLRCILMSVCSR